jgi:DNA processing protein
MKYVHAFLQIPGVGYPILAKIWSCFHDWRYAWINAHREEFLALGIKVPVVDAIEAVRRSFDFEGAAAELWRRDIFLIGRESDEYPVILKTIAEPPFLLYRKGAALNTLPAGIAVVGTRVPSTYGERMSYDVSEKLGLCGFTVVSGLAFGVDAAAHLAAAQSDYPTVAVLASGIDKVTPSSHASLAQMILEKGGAIVSEYPPNFGAMKHHFLWRNRIISGLCKATIVIEAQSRSGALVTAEHALAQQRKVFALVGDIDRAQAQGCLQLLRNGKAEGLYCLSQLESLNTKQQLQMGDFGGGLNDLGNAQNALSHKILCMMKKKILFDELCISFGEESSEILSALAMLEIEGALERDAGGYFRLTDSGKRLREEIIRASGLADIEEG